MKDYLTNFPSGKLSIYAAIIVIFTYNVLLERDMACTCEPQTNECSFHMGLPFLVIFVLILWTDKKFRKTWRYTCTCPCGRSGCTDVCERCCYSAFLLVIVRHMIKAALVGLLWVASVLIDGHWYVCCKNDQSEQQAQLACKDKQNITAEEQKIIAQLQNFSKTLGFFILFSVILVAALMSLIGWRKCCEGKLGCCDRKVLYDKLILEEEEHVLEEILRTAAKEKLTVTIIDKICGNRWKECFDVAQEVMKCGKPTLSEQLQQQWSKNKDEAPDTEEGCCTSSSCLLD